MSFGGVPVMLAGGALDDCREWKCVGMMLGRSWSERDCERTRPQNVIPSRDRMTSSSSPTRWHHRRRSRSTLFHRIGTFCAILAPKVCCRSGGWDRKKGRCTCVLWCDKCAHAGLMRRPSSPGCVPLSVNITRSTAEPPEPPGSAFYSHVISPSARSKK